jgi:hypothetical protein
MSIDQKTFDEVLRRHLEKARAKGIEGPPVLLLLSEKSAQGRAAYQALNGKPMDPPPDGLSEEEWRPIEVLSVEEASRVLREHAGAGGAVMAAHLVDKVLPTELWLVLLRQDDIRFRAFCNGQRLSGGALDYERPSREARPPGEVLKDEGPSSFRVSMDNGDSALVCGPTGADAAMATALVMTVTTPNMIWPHPHRRGKTVTIPMTDEDLAELLLDDYATGDGPRPVAEAIHALRRLGKREDAWLMKVLWGWPALRELAKKVHEELTGEPG